MTKPLTEKEIKEQEMRAEEVACIDDVHALFMTYSAINIVDAIRYLARANEVDVPSVKVRVRAEIAVVCLTYTRKD